MASLIRYMGGLLSYPRTESTAYPEGFDFVTTVRALRGHPEWGEHALQVLTTAPCSPQVRAQQGHPEWGEHAAWLLEEPGRLQVR